MRICFFGDSFVNGTGDDDCLGWPGRICAEARARGRDVTLYNLGVRRETSADIAARWIREAGVRLPPDQDGRLMFSFGVNDCVIENGQPRIAEADSLRHARTILEHARATRPVLMVGPPCTGDVLLDARVKRLSDRLEDLCRDLAIPMLPIFARLDATPLWRREAELGDGIHPNRGGYPLIADAMLDWQPWRDWMGGVRFDLDACQPGMDSNDIARRGAGDRPDRKRRDDPRPHLAPVRRR